ncbi:MAG: putative toxin-antitoxin system toxin component, PIN family [Geminicoccaceae bacterium]
MRLVLDCNVLVAAARGSETCRHVVIRAMADHETIVSEAIMAEYRQVSARPKHRPYQATLAAMIEAMAAVAITVQPAEATFGLADPDDEVYLATAIAGAAVLLVTGNRRHFREDRYGPVEIMSPRAFLDRVD